MFHRQSRAFPPKEGILPRLADYKRTEIQLLSGRHCRELPSSLPSVRDAQLPPSRAWGTILGMKGIWEKLRTDPHLLRVTLQAHHC